MAAAARAQVAPLLKAALPHIRKHGFTLTAIQAGQSSAASSLGPRQGDEADQEARQYGFGSARGASLALLSTFDRASLGVQFGEEQSVDPQEPEPASEDEAWRKSIDRIAGKIRQSSAIHDHLVDALALLAIGKANGQDRQMQNPPLAFMGRRIPSPRPITDRAFDVASTALYASRWKGHLHSDWYSTRTRLSLAFLLAEFRLLAPIQGDVGMRGDHMDDLVSELEAGSTPSSDNLAAALNVLYKVAGEPSSDFSQSGIRRQGHPAGSFPSAGKWAHWGTTGWLGIFRSLGL